MYRHIVLFAFLIFGLCLTAQAQTPATPGFEFILNDESKPLNERAVAIVVGVHRLQHQANADPALEKLGDDAAAYARALKAHGGFDTIILIQDQAVSRTNVVNAIRLFGEEAVASPKEFHLHWAGPVIDNYTLATYGYDPTKAYGEGGAMPIDILGLMMFSIEQEGHLVVSFDTVPAPAPFAGEDMDKFSASLWNNSNSAALSPGPGCSSFTNSMVSAVNDARGRRLSIKEMVSAITRTCGVAPIVHMREGQTDDGKVIPRLPDSATFVPLGDLREASPMPSPAPITVTQPDPVPVVRQERKIPRGVGYGLTGVGLALMGVTGYEAVRLSEALEVRNTTTSFNEYGEATRQANTAAATASVLGTLGLGSLTAGLVVTF